MPNIKFTKHALISSVALMVICFAMLLGTTFAWFTDSVVSAGNVITAGNLDIEVEYTLDGENWADLDGANDLFQKGLWEPGHTEVVVLKVSNKGSLYAKYNANMNIVNEVIGKNQDGEDIVLSDILTVSTLTQQAIDADGNANMDGKDSLGLAFNSENGVKYELTKPFAEANVIGNDVMLEAGAAYYVFIKVDMPETVGNEANHDGVNIPTIEFGINFVATQFAKENDSFGPNYDKDAEYPIVPDFIVKTQEELKYALTKGGNIQLANDILVDIGESTDSAFYVGENVDAVLDLNGKTIQTTDDYEGIALFWNRRDASLTITGNGTIIMKPAEGNSCYMFVEIGDVIIENGTFLMPYKRGNDEKPEAQNTLPYLFAGVNGTNRRANVVIYDGYFDSGYWRTDEKVSYDMRGLASINTLVNLSTNETFTIYGGTFVGYNPAWGDEASASYYEVNDEKVASTNRGSHQGVFLKGQGVDDTTLPAGYTITKSSTTKGYTVDGGFTDIIVAGNSNDKVSRPIYVVTYDGEIE